MNTKMQTKQGLLTRYALSCGCIEQETIGDSYRIILSMPSPSSRYLQVDVWDMDIKEKVQHVTGHSLTKARKTFFDFCRHYRNI